MEAGHLQDTDVPMDSASDTQIEEKSGEVISTSDPTSFQSDVKVTDVEREIPSQPPAVQAGLSTEPSDTQITETVPEPGSLKLLDGVIGEGVPQQEQEKRPPTPQDVAMEEQPQISIDPNLETATQNQTEPVTNMPNASSPPPSDDNMSLPQIHSAQPEPTAEASVKPPSLTPPSTVPHPSEEGVRLPPISYIDAQVAEAEAQAAAVASSADPQEVQAQHTSQVVDMPKETTTPPVATAEERPLNVTDALSYLDAVKVQFQDHPDVYNHFLDIMKDFKSQSIDTPGVIKRVSYLFHGHPQLIQGFNTFLPVGYRIDAQSKDLITVTTPKGTMTQTMGGGEGWSVTDKEGAGSRVGSGVLALGPGSIGVTESIHHAPSPAPPASASLDPLTVYGGMAGEGTAIEPAVQYVHKIKQRCDSEKYKQFLDILGKYHQKSGNIDEREVHRQISLLFKDDPDLRSEFRVFMPDKSWPLFDEPDMDVMYDAPDRRGGRTGTPTTMLDKAASGRRLKEKDIIPTVPLKRKRKPEKEKEREREGERESNKLLGPSKAKKTKQDASPSLSHTHARHHRESSPPRRSSQQQSHLHHHGHTIIPPQPATGPPVSSPSNDQIHFFDHVKRALENRETYNEFLKLVNLFTQDIIDSAELVRRSRSFLGDGELMRRWREILGWDDMREREAYLRDNQEGELTIWARGPGSAYAGIVLERPGRKDLSVRYGSYRKLPASEVNVTCSGRDEMCRSVLNDEWVSHPTWSSEDSGFLAHKKNVYEEALHRSEEERHEYDFHIEAIVRTISMLEPINNKIAQLPMDERNSFKLKANLGGSGKSIHQRVIKKIYGREAGLEVIQTMQDSPSLAIPVVLTRLKQKEDEWKRAQREWNKVWREVDARNYQKSLDHQGITFKAADKKAMSTKAFVTQIETARDEQIGKRASLIDPLFARTRPRHQLEFVVDDMAVMQDALKLTFSFLDHTTHQIGAAERKKIESFLRGFVPTFFMVDTEVFNQAFTAIAILDQNGDSDASDEVGSVDDAEISSLASGSSKANRSGHRKGVASGGGDLRKKLLKSEQAKSTGRKTRAQEAASPSTSRQATPVLPDVTMVDAPDEDSSANAAETHRNERRPRKNIFFSNTTCYVLLRLIEVLYSRFLLFKSLSASMAANGSGVNGRASKNHSALQVAETKSRDKINVAEHYYDLVRDSCEKLFNNDIEQSAFEDQMRHMFGIKEAYKIFTIDKLIGSIIKQVQTILMDPKSQELLELLKKERVYGTLSTQDQINSRQHAERIMGPDENLFRMDWLPESNTMTIQLLGKDDPNFDDTEVTTGRWQAYIDSFVSSESTENLPPHRLKRPFLRKNLSPTADGGLPKIIARGSLEIKVCVRTYRFFYVSDTEELLSRLPDTAEVTQLQQHQLAVKQSARLKWIERVAAGPLDLSKSSKPAA